MIVGEVVAEAEAVEVAVDAGARRWAVAEAAVVVVLGAAAVAAAADVGGVAVAVEDGTEAARHLRAGSTGTGDHHHLRADVTISAVAIVTGSAARATVPVAVPAAVAATAGADRPARGPYHSTKTASAGTGRLDPTIGTTNGRRQDHQELVAAAVLLAVQVSAVVMSVVVVEAAAVVVAAAAAAVVVVPDRGSAVGRLRTAAACNPQGITHRPDTSDPLDPINRTSRMDRIRINHRTRRINRDGTNGQADGVVGAIGTRIKVGATGVTGAIGVTSRAPVPAPLSREPPTRARVTSRVNRTRSNSNKGNRRSNGPATTLRNNGTSGNSGSNSSKDGRGINKELSKGTLRTPRRGLNITRIMAARTLATLATTRPPSTRSDPCRRPAAQHNHNTSRCVPSTLEGDTLLAPSHNIRDIFFYLSFYKRVYIEKLIKQLVHTISVKLKSYSNLLVTRTEVLDNQSSMLTITLHHLQLYIQFYKLVNT